MTREDPSHSFIVGGGETGALVRSIDWSHSTLGPLENWPQSLRTAMSICLSSRFPIALYWGPEFSMLYNDSLLPMVGAKKHPQAMGQPALEVLAEIRDIIEPMLRHVRTTGEATWSEDLLLPLVRLDVAEESYFTFTYSPIRDESGGVGGVFCAVIETSDKVIDGRRLRLLNALAEASRAKTAASACAKVAIKIADAANDIPFALLYLRDDRSGFCTLAGAANLEPGSVYAPMSIDPHFAASATPAPLWPLGEVATQRGAPLQIDFENGPRGARGAVILPIDGGGRAQPLGYIIVGLSPMLRSGHSYNRFHNLLAASVSQAVNGAAAYEAERQRAEALAALDQAKTAFFSNISHEFRTPLTLMLGPIDDMRAVPARDSNEREQLELMHRNALRLLKLVNTLLEFSRIEAGRIDAVYEPTDLASLTTDLASSFRAATDRAGLALVVDCPPLGELIYVDHAMWEKIVLNLLSNAFKFTFNGSITVSLRLVDDEVELSVIDTGVGIAEADMPRLFERFHRIRGVRARTHEGTGIGLALVQELSRLHGGSVSATHAQWRGAKFSVRIKRGHAHLPREQIKRGDDRATASLDAAPFVEEALRWLPSDQRSSVPPLPAAQALPPNPSAPQERRARVLVADDNADMRSYLVRLLSGRYDVEAVADGVQALAAAKRERPDLVLSDVMMPEMDGFELVDALRSELTTREIPIMLLSARAGDEATAAGLEAGADDYVAKPFSARELAARIDAQLARSRLRAAEAAHRKYITAVFEHAPVGIAILRGPEHVYEFVNASYLELVPHKQAAELLGSSVRAALPELVEQGVIDLLDGVYRSGEPFVGRSFRVALARGQRGAIEDRYFDLVYQPIRNAGGVIEGIVAVAFDVTELARARGEAEAAARAKDDFMAILGHELRNPLAPILTAVELMSLRGTSPRERALIERQVRHVVRLVDDLLDVSRITRDKIALKHELIDVADLLADAIEAASPLIEQQDHTLQVFAEAGKYVVRGDRIRLCQVLSNLLTNAAKYTNVGGVIDVHASATESEVQICVKDNGQGIAPALLPKVFDLFEQGARTLDRAQGGLGIGLAIVKNLVTLHGGTVSVASDGVGRGSTFTVHLPRAAGVAPSRDERPTWPALKLATRVRVLIVDDNEDAAEILEEALSSMGHTTRVVHDGAAALIAAPEFMPTIVLIDIGLPGMNGYELARELRQRYGQAFYLVAVTGYGQETDRARSREAGFDEHLVKPVQLALIATVLKRHADSLPKEAAGGRAPGK